MTKNLNKTFHFPEGKNQIVDIDAATYSEARRKYFKLRGHFPENEPTIKED